MTRHLLILFVILVCIPHVDAANVQDTSRIFVPHGEGKQSLAGKIDYLDDPNGKFTIEQVVHEKSNEFKVLDNSKKLGYDYKNQVLWMRVAIDTKEYKDPYFFLSQNYEHISNLQIFYPTDSGYQRIELDEKLPNEGRTLNVREYLFKTPTPATSPNNYYFRVAAKARFLKIDFSWAGMAGAIESVHNSELAYGLFFGALIAMLLYNLSLYVVLLDRSYLYYIYYVACFTLVFLHIYGFTPYLLQLNPTWEAFFALCGYGTIHAMILFARHFLVLKTATKWIDQYLLFFQWLLVFGGGACFFMEVGQPFKYLNFVILLVIPAIIIAGIKRWYQGYAPAKIYTLGWAVFASALALLSLRSVGLLPANFITNNAVMVASVWEAVIFSIALAFRIKLIEKEKKEALTQERALLEDRVAERTAELSTALESNRKMVANASHELRTPVNSLRLLLDATAMSNADTHDVIPKVSAIAAHMSQLVENLLLLEAAHQGSVAREGVLQDFDLAEEISATCKLLGPMRQGSKAEFSFNVDMCANVVVHGDVTSLRRIIINLLSNAFKFTAEGEVSLKAAAEIDPETHKVVCTVRVKDTGIGILPEMQERIFDPFVTSGTHRGFTGTGLGLAISSELARLFGGSLILLNSAQNVGSEFMFNAHFIPATRFGTDTPLTEYGSVVVPAKKRLRILLAEDDPTTAEAVQIIIRLLQHEVTHVATFDALSQSLIGSQRRFDVALIDHRLPGGNGLDMINLCKTNKWASETRMVLMTADATIEVIEAAMGVCDEIITKPTTAHRLRQLLGEGEQENSGAPTRLFDPFPIVSLHKAGAAKDCLYNLEKMFCESIDDTVRQLLDLINRSSGPDEFIPQLRYIVHHVRSACLIVGAEALSVEFQQLDRDGDSKAFHASLSKIQSVYEETKADLERLINEIPSNAGH